MVQLPKQGSAAVRICTFRSRYIHSLGGAICFPRVLSLSENHLLNATSQSSDNASQRRHAPALPSCLLFLKEN